MKHLYIFGKLYKAKLEDVPSDTEIWLLGTDKREGADLYFELHGIKVTHENVIYSLPDEVYKKGLPINNSICALLVYAWIKGYREITIKDCPMNATHEYIEQRPALAWCVGYLNAKGLKVTWEDGIKNTDYGRTI